MPVVIPYTKQTWTDGVSSCSAARNNVHEDGINDSHFQPTVRVFHSAAQAIVTATITTLAFNSERYDTAGNVASTMHDNVTNNSRLTARHAGKYHIGGNIAFAANATGNRIAIIWLNGLTEIARVTIPGIAVDAAALGVSCDYTLAVNDFVELRAYQTSGGSLDVSVFAQTSPEFWMHRVG